MSKPTTRWQKAGFAGIGAALALGSSVAGASIAAADDTGELQSGQENVTQGMDDQAAADLTYTFDNSFDRNATITFDLTDSADAANDCSTQAGTDAAISYNHAPSVSLDTDGDARVPTYTTELESGACPDTFTVTLTQPSDSNASDFTLDVSDISYDLGPDAAPGDVTVTATGPEAADTDTTSNANVVNKSFMDSPIVAANDNATGKALKDAEYSESTPGAYFESGDNTVALTLDNGVFTDGVTPQISVPSGYTVSDAPAPGGTEGAPETDGTNTYTFNVNGPADLTAADVTVSGLEYDATSAEGTTSTLTSLVTNVTSGDTHNDVVDPIVNVVGFGPSHRIGGLNRYETAARVFQQYVTDNGAPASVVLSGGEKFPDALSANYLAGEDAVTGNTGTLLTHDDELSPAARDAIVDNGIETVYITGGNAAVSNSIESDLESTHVGGNPNNDFINVTRLAGSNRYQTNQRVNEYQIQSPRDTVIMAAGTAPYDSLAGGPVANNQEYPLVLTKGATMNHGEGAQLRDFQASNVVILGGTGVVSQEIEDQLNSDGYNVSRLAGDTRYETAAQIATWATDGVDLNGDGDTSDGVGEADQGFDSDTTNVANGKAYPDALSAGPLAGSEGSALVLSKGADDVGAGTSDYLTGKSVGTAGDGSTIATLRALGLTGATTNSMMEDAAADIGSQDTTSSDTP